MGSQQAQEQHEHNNTSGPPAGPPAQLPDQTETAQLPNVGSECANTARQRGEGRHSTSFLFHFPINQNNESYVCMSSHYRERAQSVYSANDITL